MHCVCYPNRGDEKVTQKDAVQDTSWLIEYTYSILTVLHPKMSDQHYSEPEESEYAVVRRTTSSSFRCKG